MATAPSPNVAQYRVTPPRGVKVLAIIPVVIVAVVFAALAMSATSHNRILLVIVGAIAAALIAIVCWAASTRARIVLLVDRDSGTLTIHAPFYERTIWLADLASVTAAPDDGMNVGLVNWFVTGRPQSASGVRINVGGKAALDLMLTNRNTYHIIVHDVPQAEKLADAINSYKR